MPNVLFIPLSVKDPDAPYAGATARGIPLVLVEKLDGADGFSARFSPFVASADGRKAWMVYTDEIEPEKAADFVDAEYPHTHMVTGTLSMKDPLGINFVVYEKGSKTPVYTATADVKEEDFLKFLGSFAVDLFVKLGGKTTVDLSKRLQNFGTTSFDAFKHYLSGRSQNLSHYYGLSIERPDISFDDYLASLMEDPTFVESSRHLSALAMEFVLSDALPSEIAADALKRATALAAEAQPLYGALAVAMQRMNDAEGAGKAYAAAIESDEESPLSLGLREDYGTFLQAVGKHGEAIEQFMDAKNRGAEGLDLLEKLAVSYAVIGKAADAEALWEKVTDRDPDRAAACSNLARLAMDRGDDERALEYLERGRSASLASWPLYGLFALYYRDRKEADNARDMLSEFIERTDPSYIPADAYLSYARLCLETGLKEEAVSALEAARDLAGNSVAGRKAQLILFSIEHPEDLQRLTEAEYSAYSGEPKEALETLTKLEEEHPGLWSINIALGMAYNRLKSPERALAELHKADKKAPNEPDVLSTLGMLYFEIGQYEKATEFLGRAVDIDPNHPGTLCRMAVLLMNAGRTEEARGYLERAERAAPDNPVIKSYLEKLEAGQ